MANLTTGPTSEGTEKDSWTSPLGSLLPDAFVLGLLGLLGWGLIKVNSGQHDSGMAPDFTLSSFFGQGRQVDVFEYGPLEPGERAAVSLNGGLELLHIAPAGSMAAQSATSGDAFPTKALASVGVALGVVLMIVGLWWYLRPDPVDVQEIEEVTAVDYDELVTRIALLDEADAQGEINGSAYARYRAQLLHQATALIPQSSE